MSEREIVQSMQTLIDAGIVEFERWRPEFSDDRMYVTRRAQKAAYDQRRNTNRKGA